MSLIKDECAVIKHDPVETKSPVLTLNNQKHLKTAAFRDTKWTKTKSQKHNLGHKSGIKRESIMHVMT